jgi:hypothetical protein
MEWAPVVRLLALSAAVAVGACASASVGNDDSSRVAAVGRVEGIEAQHGYLTAMFPTGRAIVSMDKREIGHYFVGDEIRIDSYGRPLPKR